MITTGLIHSTKELYSSQSGDCGIWTVHKWRQENFISSALYSTISSGLPKARGNNRIFTLSAIHNEAASSYLGLIPVYFINIHAAENEIHHSGTTVSELMLNGKRPESIFHENKKEEILLSYLVDLIW